MDFQQAFAQDLSQRTGTSVDGSAVGSSDDVQSQLSSLSDFLGALDDTSKQTIDIIAQSGVDLSSATDDSGSPLGLPGGGLLTVAAQAGLGLTALLSDGQASLQVALNESGGGGQAVASNTPDPGTPTDPGTTTDPGTGDSAGTGDNGPTGDTGETGDAGDPSTA